MTVKLYQPPDLPQGAPPPDVLPVEQPLVEYLIDRFLDHLDKSSDSSTENAEISTRMVLAMFSQWSRRYLASQTVIESQHGDPESLRFRLQAHPVWLRLGLPDSSPETHGAA